MIIMNAQLMVFMDDIQFLVFIGNRFCYCCNKNNITQFNPLCYLSGLFFNSYVHICIIMNTGKTSYPKEKIRILFLENISDVAIKNFRQHDYTKVDKINKALSEEELIKEIRDVHILGIRSKTQITKNILDRLRIG